MLCVRSAQVTATCSLRSTTGGRPYKPVLRKSLSLPYESGLEWDMDSSKIEALLGTTFTHPAEVVRRVFSRTGEGVQKAFVQAWTGEPHPEGGFWKLLYRSHPVTQDPTFCGAAARPAASSIAYTLADASPMGFFHRNADSDIFHVWHGGDALVYFVLVPAPGADGVLARTLSNGHPVVDACGAVRVPGTPYLDSTDSPVVPCPDVAAGTPIVIRAASGAALVVATVGRASPTLLVPAGTWKASVLSTTATVPWVDMTNADGPTSTDAADPGAARGGAAGAGAGSGAASEAGAGAGTSNQSMSSAEVGNGYGTVVELVTPGFNPSGHSMGGLDLASEFPAFAGVVQALVRVDKTVHGYEVAERLAS